MNNLTSVKNVLSYVKAKIRANKGEETINTVLLVVAGLVLVALFITVVVGGGKTAISSAGGMITNITNQALESAVGE